MPLRLRRGTDAERLTITPSEGELIYTTDLKRVFIGDGATLGGLPLTAEATIDNLESNLDLNNFNIVGVGNINIDGNVTVTGNLDGTFIGSVDGDVKGSLFADDSTILVDGLSGSHYGLFNGNLIGNVTGNVFGNITGNVFGNVTGDVLGNVTGNLIGSVDGNVTGSLKGSVFGDNSSTIIDGITSSVLGTVRGKIDSTQDARIVVDDENRIGVSIFLKTAPNKGRVFSLFGYKGSITSPQQPDTNSRLVFGFNFWDTALNIYDQKALISTNTNADDTGRIFIGAKDIATNTINYGLRINGSTGTTLLSNFGRVFLDAPTVLFGDLAVENNEIINPTTNQDIKIVCNGTGKIILSAASVNIGDLIVESNQIINPVSNQNIKLVCNGTGTVELSVPTQTTVGVAGPANALPASPDIYIKINVNGVDYVVPAFAVS